MGKQKEARRKIAPDTELVVRGENVEPTDAILAEVLCEIAAEAGGKARIDESDPVIMEKIAARLRKKGVDPETGGWLQ